MSQKSYNNNPSLYLLPTPIGNFDDITLRTIKILKQIDVLFCEDTRVTGLLLKHLNIKCKLITNHLHNEKENKKKLMELLKNNKTVGLVSDRGTPIISDPGCELVKEAIKNNFNVISIPGPTALIPALTSSGLDARAFLFYGFLDAKETKRQKQLKELKNYPMTLIFYEAPHRLSKTLNDMLEILGNRKISISREITKKFEEIYRGNIEEVIKETVNVKGEIVIVLSGNNGKIDYQNISILEHINLYLLDGLEIKEAIKQVAKDRKLTKNVVYKEYHQKR